MTSLDTHTAPGPSQAPTRVVIAINPPGEYTVVIDAAARLAVRLQATLEAVLVEDPGLLDIARIPSAQVVDSSGRNRNLDDRTMQRAWRLERCRLDEALRRCTASLNVRASVRTVQGRFAAEALSLAAQVDVTVLAHCSCLAGELSRAQSGWLRARPGARPGSAAARRARAVWALFDASAAAERALTLAAQLAAEYQSNLLVLYPHQPATAGDRISERARSLIRDRAPGATLVPVAGKLAQVLTVLRRPEGCSLVLAPRDIVDENSVPAILDAFSVRAYPLVLVA